mmetsp:Transcript_21821/g.29669  ORF Transcript_21821/g.29669 Transcript_21821/m.29669 type:complete len:132 (+) Transcript_21821:101-496(+)
MLVENWGEVCGLLKKGSGVDAWFFFYAKDSLAPIAMLTNAGTVINEAAYMTVMWRSIGLEGMSQEVQRTDMDIAVGIALCRMRTSTSTGSMSVSTANGHHPTALLCNCRTPQRRSSHAAGMTTSFPREVAM